MWKKSLAYLIVSYVITSTVGLLGYAFYMGGWKAFFMFVGAFVGLFGAIGLAFLIIWAFWYVFVES